MTNPSPTSSADAQHRLFAAMEATDTDALDELLDEEFTLTHMTGVVQSKRQWLEEITTARRGPMPGAPGDTTCSSSAARVEMQKSPGPDGPGDFRVMTQAASFLRPGAPE